MELDLKLFSRYVGYILQELEIKEIIAKVDKEKAKKDEDKLEADRLAADAREKREAWMREAGKL